MANVSSEADRLHEAGRRKILRVCLIWGVPLLILLAILGLQAAGTIHLEEYFWTDPAKVDMPLLWRSLGGLALFQFLCVALGVFQGWSGMRRAKQLRQQQLAPDRSSSSGRSA